MMRRLRLIIVIMFIGLQANSYDYVKPIFDTTAAFTLFVINDCFKYGMRLSALPQDVNITTIDINTPIGAQTFALVTTVCIIEDSYYNTATIQDNTYLPLYVYDDLWTRTDFFAYPKMIFLKVEGISITYDATYMSDLPLTYENSNSLIDKKVKNKNMCILGILTCELIETNPNAEHMGSGNGRLIGLAPFVKNHRPLRFYDGSSWEKIVSHKPDVYTTLILNPDADDPDELLEAAEENRSYDHPLKFAGLKDNTSKSNKDTITGTYDTVTIKLERAVK